MREGWSEGEQNLHEEFLKRKGGREQGKREGGRGREGGREGGGLSVRHTDGNRWSSLQQNYDNLSGSPLQGSSVCVHQHIHVHYKTLSSVLAHTHARTHTRTHTQYNLEW